MKRTRPPDLAAQSPRCARSAKERPSRPLVLREKARNVLLDDEDRAGRDDGEDELAVLDLKRRPTAGNGGALRVKRDVVSSR